MISVHQERRGAQESECCYLRDKSELERMHRRGALCAAGGDACGAAPVETVEDPSKLKLELPCDPAIPLLGIHPKEMKTLP